MKMLTDNDLQCLCFHLKHRLFAVAYHLTGQASGRDAALLAVVRSRQFHAYRHGKNVLALSGKAASQIESRKQGLGYD